MKNFKFPTNIKQIGSISPGLKIYVEDYVATYLNQYTKNSGQEDQLAVLFGKYKTIDEQEVLFICGAVAGKHCANESGILKFTDKSWEYIITQKENHFNELEVAGFAVSQPSYGTYLNINYANYHIENFRKKYQVLFVIDPIENVSSFYVYNDDQSDLEEITGYFIYYEKNKDMQEYMIQNRVTKDKKINEGTTRFILNGYGGEIKKTQRKHILNKLSEEESKQEKSINEIDNDIENEQDKIVMPRYPQKLSSTALEQKRIINLLAGLCAVLFILTFVMGMGLIRNTDRITLLETDLKTLSTTYKNLVATIKDTEVFAAQNTQSSDQNVNTSQVIEENKNLLTENPINLLVQNREETATAAMNNLQEDNEDNTVAALGDIPEFYTVQTGDNLLQISQKFYGTKDRAQDIMKINNITDANKIFVGQKLKMPRE